VHRRGRARRGRHSESKIQDSKEQKSVGWSETSPGDPRGAAPIPNSKFKIQDSGLIKLVNVFDLLLQVIHQQVSVERVGCGEVGLGTAHLGNFLDKVD